MLDDLLIYLYIIPAAIIAVVLHEFSHGLVSYLFGDPTPKVTGRLSLNPAKHLDLFGILCLVVFHFGWAKPVQVNPTYYKKPKLCMTLVALAGPLMNFIIATISIFIICLIYRFASINVVTNEIITFFNALAVINLGLGVFNLIPLPPLDGSKIIGCILPDKAYNEYMGYQRYGMFFMLGLVILINIFSIFNLPSPISFVIDQVYNFLFEIFFKILF